MTLSYTSVLPHEGGPERDLHAPAHTCRRCLMMPRRLLIFRLRPSGSRQDQGTKALLSRSPRCTQLLLEHPGYRVREMARARGVLRVIQQEPLPSLPSIIAACDPLPSFANSGANAERPRSPNRRRRWCSRNRYSCMSMWYIQGCWEQ